MATPVTESSAPNDIELPPAVHWPTVYAMAGIGGGLVAVLLAVAMIAAAQSPPATQSPQPAAPVAVVLPTTHPPRIAKPAAPAETAPADSGPAVWKPLAPPALPVQVPAPTPVSHPWDAVPIPGAPTFSPISTPQASATPEDSPLYADLQDHVQTADLDAVAGTAAKLLGKSRKGSARAGEEEAPDSISELIARRPDLHGLPVRGKAECTASAGAAKQLQEISLLLRRFQSRLPSRTIADRDDPPSLEPRPTNHYDAVSTADRNKQFVAFLSRQQSWLKDDNATVLAQMLEVEDVPVRLQLTKMLTAIHGSKAGGALARQALFDLSADVRDAAVQALKDRPAGEYRTTLLDGFRYPWPPVADHAAEAIAVLKDRDALKGLKALLDQPDPSAPFLNEQKRWMAPQLVKVNHLANCLLCHAPSSDSTDIVRGLVPKRDEPLPVEYYARSHGDFVRADVTYLRQDFSVMEYVDSPGPWPVLQRFDYLVRIRELTDQEIIDQVDVGPASAPTYPQREAVLRALKSLTASDGQLDPAVPIGKVGLGP